jgi:hypothetical protein
MNRLAHLIRTTLPGAAAGTVIPGVGGRVFMASLMLASGGNAGFTWGGSMRPLLLALAVGRLSGLQPLDTKTGERR